MTTLAADPARSDGSPGSDTTSALVSMPAASPASVSTPTQQPSGEPDRRALASDVLASVGIMLFSITVAAGFARVFAGWNFFDNLVVLAVVGHGVGLVSRRLGLPAWVFIPVVTLVLFWTIGVMFYAGTFSWGMPSGDTWALFTSELDLVREQFRVAVAPVLDGGGWDVLAAIGMAFAVALADAFAFGALARAEALVPGGVLFVFIAALGADRLRVELSMALVAAGVVATVLLRAHHAPGGIGPTRGRPVARVLSQAAGVATIVALTAGFVGQRLPGATNEPLFETRGGDGNGTEVSPLVDIRSRLTNQKNAELFVVQANAESYWRSATLAEFDGRTWKPVDRALETNGGELATRSSTQEIRQQVRIVGLTGSLVPAAPDPIAASGPSALQFDSGTTTLQTLDAEVVRGDTFDIVSSSPRFDPNVLAAATSLDPDDDVYLDLPDNFPDVARDLAVEVTAGATSSYDAALKLQNWFRSEFTYSLEVQPGHGSNAIEGFLRDRVGYCEQFAGTYAAMMRSLDIPARVSVGFTTGRSLGGDSYSIAGKNAHAWPEVWFDDIGWVLFEPTPGRGAPGAENYTGISPEQDVSIGADSNEGGGNNDGGAASPSTTTPRLPAGERDPNEPGGAGTPTTLPTATGSSSNGSLPWTLFAMVVLGALAIASPAVVRRVRRAASGRDTAGQIAVIWQRTLAALTDVGVPVRASDTPTETAQHAAQTFPVVARPVRSLADVVTAATYRPERAEGFEAQGAYGSSVLADSAHWARQIERAVTDSISTTSRVRRYFTRWR